MAEAKPTAKPAEKPDFNKIVKIKNVSRAPLYTSEGVIEPGDTGKCTEIEARRFHKVAERA